MQFILVHDASSGASALSERLRAELLADRKVLWLVCGGSSIPTIAAIMNAIPANLTKKLTIMLTDERYGPVGHPDSNATQLLAAGFDTQLAEFIPVLTPDTNVSMEVAAERYNEIAKEAFTDAEVVIGVFGIGPDGHIAGILPHSKATNTADFAVGYSAPPFMRLTLSFHALKRLAIGYAFVFGKAKHEALEQLQNQTLPFAEQPSQVLKELPEAYIFNDQIGEKS